MKRIVFIIGHYGSGKSEVSINLAVKKRFDYLIDLDIINPYFRSRELTKHFEELGLSLISSSVPNSLGSDLSYISRDAFLPFSEQHKKAIYDFGGETLGLRLIHQFVPYLTRDEVSLYVCLNVFRSETDSVEKIINLVRRFESFSTLKVDGLINNSNLLGETTCNTLQDGQKIIQEASKILQIPIVLTTGTKEVLNNCNNISNDKLILDLFLRKDWM